MMVATSVVRARVERELADLCAELLALSGMAAEWEGEQQGSRESFRLEWSNVMGGLCFLDEAWRGDAMSSDQERCYRELLSGLATQLPTIRRLDLYVPPWVGKLD
jgi:hypothetical protein